MTLRSAAGALLVACALAACSSPSDNPGAERERSAAAEAGPGRLTARPGRGGGNCAPGEHFLQLGSGRNALMRVTRSARDGRKALVLALHGAGSGGSRGGVYVFRGGRGLPGGLVGAPAAEGRNG